MTNNTNTTSSRAKKEITLAEDDIKAEVQKEILALLDEDIDNEIAIMEGFYTVAEIAREVIQTAKS